MTYLERTDASISGLAGTNNCPQKSIVFCQFVIKRVVTATSLEKLPVVHPRRASCLHLQCPESLRCIDASGSVLARHRFTYQVGGYQMHDQSCPRQHHSSLAHSGSEFACMFPAQRTGICTTHIRTRCDFCSQKAAYRVYETPTLDVCHRCASSSVELPRIDAAMVIAADRAPVKAKWTPEEKNGSMNAIKRLG